MTCDAHTQISARPLACAWLATRLRATTRPGLALMLVLQARHTKWKRVMVGMLLMLLPLIIGSCTDPSAAGSFDLHIHINQLMTEPPRNHNILTKKSLTQMLVKGV